MLILDLIVLFFAVPSSMYIIKTYKQDKWNLLWIISWSTLLFIESNPFDIVLFVLGLILGYFTDIFGVFSKKWYYPHYHNRLYSISAGWGWGIVTLIIFRIYNIIIDNFNQFGWIFVILFLFGWILVELLRGEITFSNQWLVLRTIMTFLLLFVSGDIFFLFVAAIGAVYIEILGTELKVWIYRDLKPSYLYLGTGYAQLSYLCLIITRIIVKSEFPKLIQTLFIMIIIILYILDYSKSFMKSNEDIVIVQTKEV